MDNYGKFKIVYHTQYWFPPSPTPEELLRAERKLKIEKLLE